MMKLVDGHDGYMLNIVDYKYIVTVACGLS
jgi:hypothetical protein